LFSDPSLVVEAEHDQVETMTISNGQQPECSHEGHDHAVCDMKHSRILKATLIDVLGALPKESIWRVKGFVRLETGLMLLNWAFGRYELHEYQDKGYDIDGPVLLTVMGSRGEVQYNGRALAKALGATA